MNSKKQARRDGAKARFSIMSYTQWSTRPGLHKNTDYSQASYDGYVARKAVEAQALGL